MVTMGKPTLVLVIFILLIGSAGALVMVTGQSRASANGNPHPWQAIGDAYVAGDDHTLTYYAHSATPWLKQYAEAALDLSQRKFDRLSLDGNTCYSIEPQSPEAATAAFQCLSLISSGFGIANRPRQSSIWLAMAKDFYQKNRKLVDSAMGSSDPHGINGVELPPVDAIRKWPTQIIRVDPDWQVVSLRDGAASAVLGDIHAKIRIDTGSTGIYLADSLIKKLEILGQLHSVNTSINMAENIHTSKTHMFYVSHFELGPINIDNAYVNSSHSAYSLFGMNYLHALSKFTLSRNTIEHMRKLPSSMCTAMKFSHLPIVDAASYAYMAVPTSLGNLGMILDTGMTGDGPFANTSVMLKQSFGVKEASTGKITNFSSIIGTFAEGSSKIRFQTIKFPFKVDDVHTKGYIGLGDGVGHGVDGSMTRNFLKLFDVSYDFPDRTMCITPVGTRPGKR